MDLSAIRELLRAGQGPDAEQAVTRALSEVPQGPRRLALEGWVRAEQSAARGEMTAVLGQIQPVIDWAQGPDGEPALLAHCLRVLGQANARTGRLEPARRQLARAAELYGETASWDGATVRRFQAFVEQLAGHPERARSFYEQAVAGYRAAGDQAGVGSCLNGIAHVRLVSGDPEGAEASYREALATLEPLGAGRSLASTLMGLGNAQQEQGQLDLAADAYQRAFEMAQSQGHADVAAGARNATGLVCRARGDLDQAEAALREAIALAPPEVAQVTAYARVNLALLFAQQGRDAELVGVLDELGPQRQPMVAVAVDACRVLVAAGLADGPGTERLLDKLALIDGIQAVNEREVPGLLERAADRWSERSGRLALSRAVRLRAIAWRLGPRDAAGEHRAALRALRERGAGIPLGPFDLDRPIGSGGMGTVWLARHRRDEVEVAVKVLRVDRARSGRLARALHAEVRAMAALHHPGIVEVLSLGEIDEVAATMADGELVEGSAWLAMALARGETLIPHCGRLPWPSVRQILTDLLRALSHAHAREVIHLDLKPDNVLVELKGHEVVATRLTDFGIAGAMRDLHRNTGVVGTPAYMAPEQAAADWHAVGPATDLYALGCLAWALVTGAPPFSAVRPVDLLAAHQHVPVPVLVPAVPVPVGFEAWVRALLEKDPMVRVGRAREALEGLEALGEELIGAAAEPPPALVSSASTLFWLDEEQTLSEATTPVTESGVVWTTWSGSGDFRGSLASGAELLHAGRDLFAWRHPPLVGRDQERALLWKAMERAIDGEAGVALLEGPAGVGTTRLAEWLAEQAHEEAGAEVIRVTVTGQGNTMGDLVRSLARVSDLDADAAEAQLARWLDDEGLCWRIASLATDGTQSAQTAAGDVVALLNARARDRTVLVLLDGAHRGRAAWRLVRIALEPGALSNVLFVLTAHSDGVPEDPELDALGLVRIPVGPLARTDLEQLLRQRLPLDAGLAARVLERSGGNPQYAVQVLGSWIERDLLVRGVDGFALRPGVPVDLPPILGELWTQRVDALCPAEHPLRPVLELGAVLGLSVQPEVWAVACETLDLPHPEPAMAMLLKAGLASAKETDGRWSFAQAMIRDALLSHAERAGRAPDLHRAAERALHEQPQSEGVRGQHLLAAGDWSEALPLLLEGAVQQVRSGEVVAGERLLDAWVEAADALGMTDRDPRRVPALTLRAEIQIGRGSPEVTQALCRRALELIEPGDRLQRALVLEHLSQVDRQLGNDAACLATLEEARALYDKTDFVIGQADTRLAIAAMCSQMDRVDEGRAQAAEALVRYQQAGHKRQVGQVHKILSHLALAAGDLEQAESSAAVARSILHKEAHRMLEGWTAHLQGDIARERGDLEAAVAHYKDAAAMARSTGTTHWIIPQMHLATLAMNQGRTADARQALAETARRSEQIGWVVTAGTSMVLMAACDPSRDDFEATLQSGLDRLVDRDAVQAEVAEVCRRVAERTADPARAALLRSAADQLA